MHTAQRLLAHQRADDKRIRAATRCLRHLSLAGHAELQNPAPTIAWLFMTISNLPPFFVVGAVRSGTTLLRLLLGHHPRICRCDEFEYVATAISGRTEWPDSDKYADQLPLHRDFREAGYRVDRTRAFPDIAREFLVQRQRMDARELVGATVHNHFDELLRIWPDAKFIHLGRDPRDVARSCVEMGWNGNAWAAVEIWIRSEDAWQRIRKQVPADRLLEVEFEDLVADAEKALRRVTAFLGVEYDPAMLEIEKDTTYRRPSPRASRSWRDDASKFDVRAMEARLGARLAQAGYAASGEPALQISGLRELGLRLTDRYGRMRFSIRRYGAALWVSSFVSRRLLPISTWRNRTKLAIDRIDERHLK
jgi:hypothetical protein